MLKFLTHKLRTHSINEENRDGKDDENRDSGTESDEDIEEIGDSKLPARCGERACTLSPTDTGCSMGSPPPPDQHDPHSSEEELEVINGNAGAAAALGGRPPSDKPARAASECPVAAEKRKWSQVGDAAHGRRFTPENEENMSQIGNLSPSSPCSPYLKCYGEDGVHIEHSGSSDDEVHHLLTSRTTPVQFRSSPPLGAVKPERRLSGAAATVTPAPHKGRLAISPPPRLLPYEASPRKRTRHMRHAHIQRPYLDFEKMQQLKTRPVTPWQHSGDHAGELSVFCW